MLTLGQTIYQQKNNIETEKNYSEDFPVFITHKKLHENYVFIKDKAVTTAHWHEFMEIEFVSKGSGTHMINNQAYSLERGSIYIVTPSDFHYLNCYPENWLELWNVAFDISVLSPEIAELISSSKNILQAKFSEELTKSVEEAFIYCKKAFDERKKLSPLIMKNEIEKIILFVIKDIEENHRYTARSIDKNLTPIIQQTIHYIQMHFREKIPLFETAKALNISENYLGEIFTKEMGMSYNNYVNKIRLKYSKNLLKQNDLSISQICHTSGFSTASYFSKLFYNTYGELPSEYRLRKQTEALENSDILKTE